MANLILPGNADPTKVPAGNTFSAGTYYGASGTMVNNGAETLVTSVKTLTNLVSNGNFVNGTTGWAAVGATGFTVASNIATFTATVQTGNINQNISIINGHKYYMCTTVMSSGAGNLEIAIYDNLAYFVDSSFAIPTSLTFKSAYGTATNTATGVVKIMDSRASGWTQVSVKNVVLLDLTAAYGAGLEPTQAQMDALMTTLGGYIDGTCLAQKIPTGAYLTNGTTGGSEVVTSDANLIPANIKSGVVTLGITGTGSAYATGSGTTDGTSHAIVSGMAFQPSTVLVHTDAAAYWEFMSLLVNTTTSFTLNSTISHASSLNASGFDILTNSANSAYQWYAWK